MLFRRECLEDVGLFDERYFAYGDEMEIGLRAARHGWKNVEVDPPRFRNGFWEVHVFMPPRTVGGRDAWVKITPEGEVVDFDINTM